jgi:aspartyl-tRNA(Asn)/glutamyl-tRNA(Gln) amidotransferase subunit C
MAGITDAEVRHVANLARLMFSDDELKELTGQLNDILGYISKLEELDTSDIPPSTHAIKLVNVTREDVVKPSLDNSDALANAPEKEDGSFVVPRII